MKTKNQAKGLLFGLLLLALSIGCTATSPEPTNLDTEVVKDIIYADVDSWTTTLDVYYPTQPGPWPMVVNVHGTGYNKSIFGFIAEELASQGLVVYNIDVIHDVSNIFANERIACGVRFARATAEDYGGDPSRITLVGHSAGARTGAVAALAGDNFEGDCVETDGSALVDAFVGYEGSYHIATATIPELGWDPNITKEENPELLQTVNPYSYIGLNPDLQVLLLHGDDDATAWYDWPPDVSNEFHQALVEAGYDAELVIFEGAAHGDFINRYAEAFPQIIQLLVNIAQHPLP